MKNLRDQSIPAEILEGEQKVFLNLSLMILLAVNFILKYLGHTYYREGYLEIQNPGFWLLVTNALFLFAIVYLNKEAAEWKWKDLGLGKPRVWWEPILTAVLVSGAIVLLSKYIQPLFLELGNPPNISHLMVINQNLPVLITALIVTWITAAFLEELVFRAFLINSLILLLGKSKAAIWGAVVISSVIFGMLHAWQGYSGILTTSCVGLIFGVAYILNGRRIWPLIIVHGLIDTLTLISIYNM